MTNIRDEWLPACGWLPARLHARSLTLAVAVLLFAPCTQSASRQPVSAEHGMVVTAQHLATQVGVQVLREGGNAVDAAVAVGYALAVVYPAAGNLGGGGFMTLQLADGTRTFVDFREKAPLGATPDMYLDKQGQVIKGLSTQGHLAVGVPGSVSGLELARENYGTMKRPDLLRPAIALADKGFVLEQGDVNMLRSVTDDLRKDAASAAIFLKRGGEPYEVGDTLRQQDLARTLQAISDHGAAGFYKGWVSEALVKSNRQGGGILTQADLDQYRARELAPVECDYRGYRVAAMYS